MRLRSSGDGCGTKTGQDAAKVIPMTAWNNAARMLVGFDQYTLTRILLYFGGDWRKSGLCSVENSARPLRCHLIALVAVHAAVDRNVRVRGQAVLRTDATHTRMYSCRRELFAARCTRDSY